MLYLRRPIKAIIDTLHMDLGAIQKTLQEQKSAIADAAETAKKAGEEIPRSITGLHAPADERANADAYQKKAHGQQVWLTWGTWLAFLAASIYAGIAAYQAHLTRESLSNSTSSLTQTLDRMDNQTDATNRLATAMETANANVLAADRPWIGASIILDHEMAVGNAPVAIIIFINSGKRPAIVTFMQGRVRLLKSLPKDPPYLAHPPTGASASFLVPGAQMDMRLEIVQNGTLNQAMMDQISHDTFLYIYANVKYSDPADGSTHHTHVCFKYNAHPETGSPVGFYNCTIADGYNDAN
jgi:hypothetical protein